VKKLTVDELTRRAFIWAEGDRESFALCCKKGSAERENAASEARQLREYRIKKWGSTALEQAIAEATHVVDVQTGKVTPNAQAEGRAACGESRSSVELGGTGE
jgi:hypothetical protein